MKKTASESGIDQVLELMEQLRDPLSGCPWDIEQTFESILPYTLEEAYEVADAIEKEDYPALKDELGDLLLQVVFHGQMAKEKSLFDFSDITANLAAKLIRRHPHVFAGGGTSSVEQVKQQWEAIKDKERETQAKSSSILDDVPTTLPGLTRAEKLQKRVSRVGFDWAETQAVLAKLKEEVIELEQAIATGSVAEQSHELGDVLFSCVNMARHLNLKSDSVMREANQRFAMRFKRVELLAEKDGKTIEQCSEAVLECYWQQAKQLELTKASGQQKVKAIKNG